MDRDAIVAATTRAAVSMYRAFHLERQYVATYRCPCDGFTQADTTVHIRERGFDSSGLLHQNDGRLDSEVGR